MNYWQLMDKFFSTIDQSKGWYSVGWNSLNRPIIFQNKRDIQTIHLEDLDEDL